MYNLIEYSNAYSKTSRHSWQYYSDELALDANDDIDFLASKNNSALFKCKWQIIGQTGNRGRKDVQKIV